MVGGGQMGVVEIVGLFAGGNEALQLLEPVLYEDELRRVASAFLDHQEALAEYTYGFRCSWK